MSKTALAKLLREEIHKLASLVNKLEDRSQLCYPNAYDYSKCFNQTIRNLRKFRRHMKGVSFEKEYNFS